VLAPQAQQPPAELASTAAPTPAIDPLRFEFPTMDPQPVAAWRPPLYPTPWAPTPYDHFFFSRPIGANEVNWPLADYRYGGVFFQDVVHTGVDIPAPFGTPVLAAGSGKVIWAGFGLFSYKDNYDDPYGLAVAIKHDFGYQGNALYSIYGHMSVLTVQEGQSVATGDTLGQVGDTGMSTGFHLHFEVRMGSNIFQKTRNPELWLSPPQGWGILAARVMGESGELLGRQSVFIRSVESHQKWEVKTYGSGSANADPYYRENMVIGDLPAGRYLVWIEYNGVEYDCSLDIFPGAVTYFTFWGKDGFNHSPPAPPDDPFDLPDTESSGM
jgi:murein DD-endopeptidase MepM/ murein hydrolase activator NlpD